MDPALLTSSPSDQAEPTGGSPPVDALLAELRFATETGAAARAGHAAAPVLNDLGFRLVRVKLIAGPPQTLQVMAERSDGTMSIQDCEAVSKALSPVLDLDDPVTGAYRLEVSSPGIDRPLVRRSDLDRARGHEARVELSVPVDGRKRFRGLIEGVTEDRLILTLPNAKAGEPGSVEVPIPQIDEAKLMLTEALIREALRAQARAEAQDAATPERTDATTGAATRGPGRFSNRNEAKRVAPAGHRPPVGRPGASNQAPKAPRGR